MADYKFVGKWLSTALPEKYALNADYKKKLFSSSDIDENVIASVGKKEGHLSVFLRFYFSN